MRRIDLHCYPGTETWIASQGPYVEALGAYWGREWVAKSEDQVVADVTAADVQAVLVAFDIESLTGAPPCGNAYVAGMRDRHPDTFIQAWGAVDPLKGGRRSPRRWRRSRNTGCSGSTSTRSWGISRSTTWR